MKSITIGIIICILLNFNATALATNKPSNVEVNPPRLVNANKYNSIVESENIKYSNEFIDVNIKLPKITTNNKITDKIMNNMISKDILELKDEIEKDAAKTYKEFPENGDFRKYSFDSEFEVTYDKNNILSIVNTIYYYTGGAHGMTIKKPYVFDTNTGKIAYLKNFFDKNEDYRNIILGEIKKEISTHPEMYYDNIISSLNGIPIDQNFYLTNEGVVVFYDLYDIAPYVAGIREFKVPYNIFKYGFNPNLSVKADNIMIKKDKIVKENGNYSEYIYYPEVINLPNPIVEKKINTIIERDIDDFKNESIKLGGKDKKIGLAVSSIDYFLNDNIISLDITYSANDGTTLNSILYDKGYNFNLNSGENYKLENVFKKNFNYVEQINSIIDSQIKNMKSTSDYKYDYKFTTINKNQQYFIYRGNLVIMFNAGDILDKDFGNVKFYIPLNKFGDNINGIFKD